MERTVYENHGFLPASAKEKPVRQRASIISSSNELIMQQVSIFSDLSMHIKAYESVWKHMKAYESVESIREYM